MSPLSLDELARPKTTIQEGKQRFGDELVRQFLCVGSPTRGRVGPSLAVVELDEKGRVLLPASLRRKLGARRFEVRLVAGRVELAPLQDVKALKGKYRNRIKTPWAKLEEMAEKLVREGRR